MDFLLPALRVWDGDFCIGTPAGQVGAAGDQARATFVGDIGPGPLDENQEAIAETDEKENVDEQPRQPGDEA